MTEPRKTVWTLNIDDYAPEITELTRPLLERYADKIGADVKVITERCFPDWPVVYEKLQLNQLGRDSDWNIYFDADALVHPDFFDVTEILPRDTVLHNGRDVAGNRWRYDQYFRRDGRHIGSCNWFTVASNWCLDLWEPLYDLTLEEAVANITPTNTETRSGVIDPSHLIDDYTLSRNIARFGLKFTTLPNLQAEIGDAGEYLWHIYTSSVEDKVVQMRQVLDRWNVEGQVRQCG